MIYGNFKEQKKKLGLTTEQLSALSGVPVGTINKILSGETKSPRYDTLLALQHALFPNPYDEPLCVQDSAISAEAKLPGEYTVDDYRALPDDVRAELIDGNLFFMEAPSFNHQLIITNLLFEFMLYIRSNQGNCKVLTSPLDVQLDCDDRTMIQPDIVIICDKDKTNEKGIYGAPDMCIEIISESTRRRDYGLKVTKYMEADVREYWIVDCKRKTVVCYYFEGEDYPVVYNFQSKVPVRIYDGKLEIDFADIEKRVSI